MESMVLIGNAPRCGIQDAKHPGAARAETKLSFTRDCSMLSWRTEESAYEKYEEMADCNEGSSETLVEGTGSCSNGDKPVEFALSWSTSPSYIFMMLPRTSLKVSAALSNFIISARAPARRIDRQRTSSADNNFPTRLDAAFSTSKFPCIRSRRSEREHRALFAEASISTLLNVTRFLPPVAFHPAWMAADSICNVELMLFINADLRSSSDFGDAFDFALDVGRAGFLVVRVPIPVAVLVVLDVTLSFVASCLDNSLTSVFCTAFVATTLRLPVVVAIA